MKHVSNNVRVIKIVRVTKNVRATKYVLVTGDIKTHGWYKSLCNKY